MKSLNNFASIRQSFANALMDIAKDNDKIFVVSMDLKSSLYLSDFQKKYPHRFIECGIAENNAAGIAAGIAKSGNTVFLCSFACFSPGINWNTIKQSICYNNCDVKIVGSHAGLLSTELGATHQMLEDISLMRSLPNMEVFSPADAVETEKITKVISCSRTPAYLRLVRINTPLFFDSKLKFTIGKSNILQTGSDLTIIGHGPILSQAFDLSNTLKESIEIINCSSIKPLDQDTILSSVKKTGKLIVIEDHQKNGGLGEAISSLLLTNNIHTKFCHLAVDDQFGQSSKDYRDLYDFYQIGLKKLIIEAKKILK